MQDVLSKLVGKRVDLYCGSASSLRGEIVKVEGGVLHLNDTEQRMCYISIDKIVAVWEAPDEEHRAGFVSKL
jgi:uncharacterized protein DUF6897